MPPTVALTYIGVVSPARVPELGDLPVLGDDDKPRAIQRGDVIEVPEGVAYGEEATGEPGDLDYHPGVDGLLAQTLNWVRADDSNPYDRSVKEVVAHVGDDPALATAALAHERANKNRPSLIAKLEVLAAAEPPAPEPGGLPDATDADAGNDEGQA